MEFMDTYNIANKLIQLVSFQKSFNSISII